MKESKSVDDYIDNAAEWRDEIRTLRKILQSCALTEEVKWGAPCYTLDGKNLVGIGAFKSYFGLWFHQGALLQDRKSVLINAQEGKTRALRQWRMTSADDIKPAIIRSYVKEAMELSSAGKTIAPQRRRPLEMPPELESALAGSKKSTTAFEKLRPGQRREYAEYIAEAKREQTKQNRIRKILPMIQAGIGLNDRYR